MSRYGSSSNSYDRPTRTYQPTRSTKTSDVSSRSYDSPSRRYDTSTRSYDSPSRLSQPRSGHSSRSSSVSSTVSDSSRGDSRQSSSSHTFSSSQTPGSLGASSRLQSSYGSAAGRRGLQNTSGDSTQNGRSVGESPRLTRTERDEKTSSDVSSTESDRKRFGYSSARPLSHPSEESRREKENSKGVSASAGKVRSLDLVAEKFGGIGLRRSLREKTDDDKSRFGSALTRRSARNVSGEVSEKKDSRELSNLSRTQKTVITESTETPVQLKGREIQKIANVQVASRIESLKKSTQQNENRDRFGSSAARRSLRETGSMGQSTESVKSDLKEREGRSGISSSWQSKAKVSEKHEQSSEPKRSHREFGSTALEDTSIKRTEKRTEAFGGSVLKRRLQKYTGQSKSSGAVEEILASERKHEDVPPQETALDTPVQKSEMKVQSQKSFERIGKTPADDFLRRAEMRSSLRQHRRDVETSAEQTLSGDVFKRSSLRSTLPLRKDANNDSFDRSETRRSLRKMDPAKGKTNVLVDDTHSAETVQPTSETRVEVSDNWLTEESDEVFKESFGTERPIIKTKVSIEAQSTDQFGRPAWRKALRSREERPLSGQVQYHDVTSEITAEPPASMAEKFVEDSQSYSTPNRSRIPKRSDSDSSAPDSNRAASRSSEALVQKTPSRQMVKSVNSSVTDKLDQGKKKLEVSQPSKLAMSSVPKPSSAMPDMSVGESFAETPSESREDRIKRYKAERRKQLAHLTERFQDSPVSKHFIKTEESKEEKSKDGLFAETATPQKFVDTKMVLGFESQTGVAPLQEEAEHPPQESQISKRPRSVVEPAECQEESASKRPKSDEEESAKVKTKGSKNKGPTARKAVDAASRSNQISSRSQRNPPLQADAEFTYGQTKTGSASTAAEEKPVEMVVSPSVDLPVEDHWENQKEPTPEPQLATLRYTIMDEVVAMPETVAKDLSKEHHEAARGTKSAVKDADVLEATSKNVAKKIAEVKPFRQEPPEETSTVSVTSPPVQSDASDWRAKKSGDSGAFLIEGQEVDKAETKVEIAVAKKVPEKEEIVRVVRSTGKPVTKTTAPSQNLPTEAAKRTPAEVKTVVTDTVKTSGKTTTVDKKTVADTTKPNAKLTSETPKKTAVNITATTAKLSSGKIQMDTTTGNVPGTTVLKETKTDITKVTSTPTMETVPKDTRTADVARTETKQFPQQTKKDISDMKGSEAKVTTASVSQERLQGSPVGTEKKDDIVETTYAGSGQPMVAAVSAKVSQNNQQSIPPQAKLLSGVKESKTEEGPSKAKVVADKMTLETPEAISQGKTKVTESKELQVVESSITVPGSKDGKQAEPQVNVTSELKTPVKTLQQQPPASKTPESPDNLDELLRRNQKYLEEGVKKKLMRQQHVASSSSSEAEKAADGSLVPPGGKKKRISPLMRRRIKERSKSRERAEAEKEEAKAEQQISAAELLASPEQGKLGEVTLESAVTKLPPLVDVLDASRKPTDSDSTLTSVADSASVSVTGSEDHTKKKRKDKSSVRKSQLNVSATLDLGTEGLTSQGDNLDLEAAGTPRGQKLTERNKTTPVTPEEVQKATEQIARHREEVKVSSALSKFQGAEAKTEAKSKTDDLSKSTRPFARGKEFSSLIQKFSSSESCEETDRLRPGKITTKKLDLPASFSRSGTTSSDESNTEANRPRRTPERTGSLKDRARQFESGINSGAKAVQRSSSFKSESNYKSDFMRSVKQRQQQQSDKPSEELSAALNRRNKVSSENGGSSGKKTEESRIELLEAKLSMPKEDTKVEEVIKDQELISVLKSRRKASDAEYHDALEELEKLENGNEKSRSVEAEIKEVIADEEVAKVLQARRKDTDSKTADQEDVFEDSVESLDSKQTEATAKSKTVSRFEKETAKTVEESKTIVVEKSEAISKEKTKKEDSKEVKDIQTSSEKLRKNSSSAKEEQSIHERADSSSGKQVARSEMQSKPPNVVVKQKSSDKPVRGILKRSSSSDYASRSQESGPIVDPQLAAVLQGRKKLVEGSEVTGENRESEADKRNVIRQEIAQTEIHKGTEEEAEEEERPLSIAERIFMMENRIEEAKSCPVTPHTRSGVNTPRSRARSGASTPRRESIESLEEDVRPRTNPLLISDKHLMAKLEKMAEKEERGTEKRQRHPRRSRDDWRTRTLPVTLEEIQEADSLESVSSFRGLVRRKATINIFEQIKEQDKRLTYNKKTEFPQPFRKEKKSRRSSRSKTAPITAAELGSIPEGNTLLDPLRHLYEPLSAATSKADSGILSGSDADRDSLQSDSLRSLEMEVPEDDPTRQSVSARLSIFQQLEEQARAPEKEKPKNRSIGAKRMIEKKKRERSRTQPITEDEVKTASEFADTDKQESSTAKPSVSKTPSKDGSSDSEDELSRLSIAEKLKLFSRKPEEKALPPPTRSNAPVIRKRNRKLASRFNTQPITTEEVEKASKISPLALSMAKPPDNELLRSLPIAAQIEMMAQHAEATLSQPSSRAGSRASSQPGSRRSSVGTESVEAEDTGILKTSESKDPQEVKSILKHDGRKSSDSEIRGILKDGGKDSAEPRGILKHGDSEGEITSSVKSPDEPCRGILKHTDSNDSQKGHRSALRRDSKGKSEGDLPRSILKRDSLEENKAEPDKGVLKKSRSQDFKESHEIRGILKKTASSEVRSASCEVTSEDSDVTRESISVVTREETESHHVETRSNQTNGTETAAASVTVEKSETAETRKMSKIKNEAVARRRFKEPRKAEAERYHTQPADTGAPEKTPEQRKMKYGASRHHTQPITPEEKEAAEATGSGELTKTNSGSIAERLNLLKKSGEEDWKRRIRPELGLPEDVQMRVKKGPLLERPHSIADRLSKLGESQMRWTSRVEEKDAQAFTVEGKQSKNGIVLDSPVSTRKRRLPKRELSFGKGDSAPSEDGSPLQSPSRERIPIPKELISEGPPIVSVSKSSASSSSKTVITRVGGEEDREVEDAFRTMTVELPDLGEDSFNTFFSKVQGLEEEKIDVSLDDFNHLFLKAEDVLTPARRIRPKRRHLAQNRNPLKTMSVEIEQTYTEFRTGVAELELKRLKREGFAKDSSSAQVMLAEAAVKGLQSTESFNIELRKTKDSKAQTPGGADKFLPYKDLMLLHIKGRRHVQTRLVEPHVSSVNRGDSYILIRPDRVVNWNGKFSNVIEKARAADIAQFVSQKKDLGYRESSPPIIVEDEKMRHVANKNFWSALEGDEECQECGPPDEDEAYEAFIVETNMVYKVCNNTLVPYEEYWGKIPKVEMLKPEEVLVFDFGSELYVWQGNQVSMEQRRMGMKLATQLWEKGYDYSMCPVNPISGLRDEEEGAPPKKSSQRPSWAVFGKVNQNMETTLFKEKFFDWPESSRFTMRSKTPESFALKQVECDLKPYDAKLLIPVNKAPVTMLFEGSHVGRGDKWVEEMDGLRREFDILTLDVIVWHVLEYDHSKLPKHSYGQFHDGDTYVVRWQYMITASGMKTLKGQAARHSLTGRERCAYFFWQGHNSTVNEKGASALMTVELDEERGPQVRVSQGKEPPCFLNLFEGQTIVHIGKREEAETNTQGAYRLYLVRNELENEMCLMEVPLGAENLRSRTSFLLLNVKTGFLYIWHGAKSPSYTRKLAIGAANKLKEKCPLEVGLHNKASVTITELEEGSEKSEFWSAMRTRDRKLYHSLLKGKPIRHTPRLFYMNSVAGVFEAVEILNPTRCHDLVTPMPFLQSDLYKVSQPGLFLLDNHEEVYLWQGWWPEGGEDSENVHTGSAQARFNTDRRCAMQTTLQYCQEKCSSKPPTAYLVFAGLEPLAFTNLFPAWTLDEEAKESSLRDGRKPGETIIVEELLAKLTQSQYTLDELKERPLPEGVDPLKLETYLREEEFEEVLNMTKDDFYALPGWKQTKLKQKVGLF